MTKLAQNRDQLWTLMRDMRRFTLTDLADKSTMERSSIRTYLKILEKAGFIAVLKQEKYKPHVYNLVRDNGVYRPELTTEGDAKPPTGRQKMWMAMKALGNFNYKDVAFTASVTINVAKEYCIALRNACYLRVVEISKPGTPETYVFVKSKDTGLKAPQIKKDKSIYDRNLHKTVWTPEGKKS